MVMLLRLLVGAKKMVLNTGKYKIHGVKNGEKKDSLKLKWENVMLILVLHQLCHGCDNLIIDFIYINLWVLAKHNKLNKKLFLKIK